MKPGALGKVMSDHKAINRFIDDKKQELMRRWKAKVDCADLKREAAELRVSRPHVYRYNKINGKYDCFEKEQQTTTKTKTHSRGDWQQNDPGRQHVNANSNHTQQGDSNNTQHNYIRAICSPTPDCFDLCCAFRSAVEVGVQALILVARFINGFVQSGADVQGTTKDYPYFTGEFCQLGRDCFESDLIDLILKVFNTLTCICNFLNLVIPIDPINPRSDLCCAIQRIGALVVAVVTVIINAITALAVAQYDFFTMGLFFNDVSMLFDMTLDVSFLFLCNKYFTCMSA